MRNKSNSRLRRKIARNSRLRWTEIGNRLNVADYFLFLTGVSRIFRPGFADGESWSYFKIDALVLTTTFDQIIIENLLQNPVSMMLMSTNARKCMVADYPQDDALASLRSSGLVLFPTDTLWSIGVEATDPVAVLRLLRLYQLVTAPQPIEILVDSLEMLKYYVPRLHPKLETLLVYHVQPLTIQVEQVQHLPIQLTATEMPIAFRLVQDEYSRQLIQGLGNPIASMFATFDGSRLPLHFGNINSDVVSSADLVIGLDRHACIAGGPSVMVRLREDDELEFLRE